MKLEIYYGKEKPFVAIGRHQVRLLQWTYHNRVWHERDNSGITSRAIAENVAIESLVKKGVLIVNDNNQYKINL